jgi:hypothetical protein
MKTQYITFIKEHSQNHLAFLRTSENRDHLRQIVQRQFRSITTSYCWHFNGIDSLNTMTLCTTYGVINPSSGFCQAQRCDGVKRVNDITTLPFLRIGSPTPIQIFKNNRKNTSNVYDDFNQDISINYQLCQQNYLVMFY